VKPLIHTNRRLWERKETPFRGQSAIERRENSRLFPPFPPLTAFGGCFFGGMCWPQPFAAKGWALASLANQTESDWIRPNQTKKMKRSDSIRPLKSQPHTEVAIFNYRSTECGGRNMSIDPPSSRGLDYGEACEAMPPNSGFTARPSDPSPYAQALPPSPSFDESSRRGKHLALPEKGFLPNEAILGNGITVLGRVS
jgi:hypothetical protein